MPTLLNLPRELYLTVCSLLTPVDVASLAGVSKDHYLAAQHSLFDHIRIESWESLVKLVGTMMSNPVVSHISPQQAFPSPPPFVLSTDSVRNRKRLLWHKLSEAQLCEREIRRLDLNLDNATTASRMTGAVMSRCISAIARKCGNVKVSLTLTGLSEKLVKELEGFALPNVIELRLFLGQSASYSPDEGISSQIWPLTFSGSTFPHLRNIYMNSLVRSPKDMPATMQDSADMVGRNRRRGPASSIRNSRFRDDSSFEGLLAMREIKLELNTFLNAPVLNSLFGSEIIPKNLTRLEIVNCPSLHPIRDLEALATLLQRGLQLLQYLKLFLAQKHDGHDGYNMAYKYKIDKEPALHLCNIVRQLGQKIKGLDLALPFACSRMLLPRSKDNIHSHRELPTISETPLNTRPQRLMAEGYRYRRLIFNDFCKEDQEWGEMTALAGIQGKKISWEMLYDCGLGAKAVWLVSDCAPVKFSVDEVMKHPLDKRI